jgi:hypothetical protein
MRLFVVVNALNESVPWKGKVRLDLVCGGRHNSPDARRPTQTRSRHVCAVYHQDILRWPGVTSTLISQHTHTNNLVTVVTLRMETKPDCFGGQHGTKIVAMDHEMGLSLSHFPSCRIEPSGRISLPYP